MDILDQTIVEIHQALVEKKVTPLQLVEEAIRRMKENSDNALEATMEEQARQRAMELQEPEVDNVLWGIPFAIKDNFSTKGVLTTASSNILADYVPCFDATVVEKLLAAHAIPICKTTMDELAMGGSGTTGRKGVTTNPWDKKKERFVGGSSCGSAALVADGVVPFALGSDTGDSVRKPASLAGLVGMKPTWGRISRFGLFPFAPSLDHVAYFTRSVEDSAYLLDFLAGKDEKDATSSSKEVDVYESDLHASIQGKRIAVIEEILQSVSSLEVKEAFQKSCDALKEEGAIVEHVHMDEKLLKALYPTYMVISCAEATSNNANLDGIKFGIREEGETYVDLMKNTRTKGFSELIKRRFVIGSFCLMRENQEDLFLRAQKVRHLVVDKIQEILKDYDAIYLPAAPDIAPKFQNTKQADRLSSEYLIADNHLCIANFAGLPSITLPIGMKEGMPFGANLTGRIFEEKKLFQIAKKVEEHTGLCGISARRSSWNLNQ